MGSEDLSFNEFLDDYFAECDEHLTGVRALLLALDGGIGLGGIDRGTLNEIFRHFHSLKGISGMVELRPAENLAHRLEDYLRALRQGEATLTVDGVDTLLAGTQLLERVIASRRSGDAAPSIDPMVNRIAELLAETTVAAARVAEVPAASDRPRWRCTFTPSPALVARDVRVDTIRQRLGSFGMIVSAAPRVTGDGAIAFDFVVDAPLDAAQIAGLRADGVVVERVGTAPTPTPQADRASAADAGGSGGVSPSHVVRVDLTRLGDLMRNVGDLVISRARLNDVLGRVEPLIPPADWRAIQDNILAADRQLRTLREGIMRVRLVPVSEIFRRMPFVVRDLARESGKRVRLELDGQSTEIDKFLIERLMDPVLHLVRNAISHGIETAAARIAAGKPPEGTIVLSAATAGDIVRIDVSDDGRGVDAAAVIARAKAMGLPIPPGTPDAATLLAWLCAPGFSTREESDRASGRGVGMAVVRSAVDDLSGSVRLETTPGVGTRFILELPVTLAITDALVVRVADETFAVPQGAVREVMDVAVSALVQLERNEMTPYRGNALPVVRLSRMFGLPETVLDHLHLFVIGTGGSALGIAVDRIVGHREIVVRSIADSLARVEGISGATDLGDGRVVLILDPGALARQTRERPDRMLGGAPAMAN
jgi:two-component system chemotaxis sensor kinase CheA